jgi:hypothetical protein
MLVSSQTEAHWNPHVNSAAAGLEALLEQGSREASEKLVSDPISLEEEEANFSGSDFHCCLQEMHVAIVKFEPVKHACVSFGSACHLFRGNRNTGVTYFWRCHSILMETEYWHVNRAIYACQKWKSASKSIHT